jgi:hypothetical protein
MVSLERNNVDNRATVLVVAETPIGARAEQERALSTLERQKER